jgi:hypothetical protein
VLGLIRDSFGLRRCSFSLLAFKYLQQVYSRCTTHLLEPLHWYHGRQRLALALDNELVIPSRNPVEDVPKPLADFKS